MDAQNTQPELQPQVVQSITPPPIEQAKSLIAEDGGGPSFLKRLLVIFFIILILVSGGLAAWKFLFPRLVKPQEVSLTYWGLWEEENILANVIADYQKDHPQVKISYQRQSPRDYRERLQSAFARGEGPDIFRFHNTWIPMLRNELAALPADVLGTSSFEQTFYPVVKSDLRLQDSYVGLPLEIDGLGLFVNEDIFRAAGKPLPTTWEELRQTALRLTVKDSEGRIQIAGVALGRTENIDHWSDILGLMMLQNGVSLNNPTGNLAEDALTYFTIFSEVDHVWDETLPSSTVAFASGKLAMYFAPSWRVLEIKKINPSLSFKVIPVPQLPGTNLTWASYWVEGVSKRSKNQQAAWEFLKYLSSKDTLPKLYQAASQTRLFGEPYSRLDLANLLKDDSYLGAYITQAPTAQTWYLASRTFDNGINDKMIKYFENAVNGVNQGKTPKEALQTASQGVSQVLSQYGLSSPVLR